MSSWEIHGNLRIIMEAIMGKASVKMGIFQPTTFDDTGGSLCILGWKILESSRFATFLFSSKRLSQRGIQHFLGANMQHPALESVLDNLEPSFKSMSR